MKCRDYVYRRVKEGSIVGRLEVQIIVGKSKNGSNVWRCLCTCGNVVDVISSSLNSGLKQSCGCLYDEIKGKQTVTHGYSKSKTYNSWLAMKQRCTDKNSDFYDYYGGRGISICLEWINSFEKFLEDMGKRPDNMTLDRIDVNGNYNKENCRWIDNSEQGYNGRIRINNNTGKTGVSFHKKFNKYQANIGVNNKSIYLGLFSNLEEAIAARKAAELKYFGYNKE